MRLKVSSAKRRPFCLGLNELTDESCCFRCVSAWCSQLLTLDRLAAIFQPTRRNIICTWRKALTACSLTSLLLLLLYLVPYLTYVTKEGAEEDTGSTLASFMHACSRYGNWYPGASILDFLMTYMIPVCVMFPSWAVIFKRLAIRSKKAQVIGVTEKWTAERIRRLNKTTLCIGTVVNVAVLATIPHGINMLIVHFQEQRTTAKNMYIVFGIELLDVIGRGCHVYLLSCVSGQFRRSVYAILCPDRVALDADLMSSSVRRSALVDRLAPVAKTAARDKRVVGLNLKNGVRRATPHPIKTGKWVPPKFKERAKAPLRSLRDLSPSFDCAPPIPSSNGTRETKTDSKVTIQSDVVTYMWKAWGPQVMLFKIHFTAVSW